jgi:hypothetical protein
MGARVLRVGGTACGGGAILGIVGCVNNVVGMMPRANNA